ncbi:DMP19 family protein [Alkalihalobacterium chitinilyticum]|uniref:DNA mimic protein DMP19 C-terminal domain-containing protein n=1 Tax=Alkalihalobacterium chitinilyticum TaxID=2980103 RepID=A0ABT5VIS1_9BACI|nr:hypothetical protein [Alkalihalobacterium chitinilyticum]MDE5415155.1 hypothetical protein [Alkalihalobacterium chitinilyticum]
MSYKMKRKDLLTKEDIWNAVITVMVEFNFPTENEVANDTYIVYNYYSELESGGHESLLNWFSWHIEEVGISNYLKELTRILEKIGAHDYSKIEKMYGEELWRLFQALENGEEAEEDLYEVIEKADQAYHQVNGKLDELLERYFVQIYENIIDIEE